MPILAALSLLGTIGSVLSFPSNVASFTDFLDQLSNNAQYIEQNDSNWSNNRALYPNQSIPELSTTNPTDVDPSPELAARLRASGYQPVTGMNTLTQQELDREKPVQTLPPAYIEEGPAK